MKFPVSKALGGSILALLLGSTSVTSGEISLAISEDSIDGAGRNIMRTAEGGIVAAFATGAAAEAQLVFSRSVDSGRTWNNLTVDDVNGNVVQAAVDSNFQGSYLAFTEELNGEMVGRIAYTSAPFADDASFVVSQSVTPAGVIPQDTFIQASRAGWGNLADENAETVVYGWQDANSKGLYIGVSPDGVTFPMAELVVMDEHATSGPAVAIRGNYVIATYQTTNPDFAPSDLPEELTAGRSYPAWVESTDGGKTWSEPVPLFGYTTADFPNMDVQHEKGMVTNVSLSGGTALPNSPILNWSSSRNDDSSPFSNSQDKSLPVDDGSIDPAMMLAEGDLRLGGTTFVQTSMMAVDETTGEQGEVSIVSFRPIEPDADWTHVIANNPMTTQAAGVDAQTSMFGADASQFQYSALIDTAVRATTYKEVDPATGGTRLVAAVSTDTGKTFDHHLSLGEIELAALGIEDFADATIFAASQCLFEDRNGEVYIDIVVAQNDSLQYASIPIGVNAAELRTQ